MHEKLGLWLETLFRIRVPDQVVCVLGPREHSDIREARTHLKNFEIYRMSKSLCVFPEGYKIIPPEEFEGLDGTVPDIREEQEARDLGLALQEFLKINKHSKIVFLHDNDPFWRDVCGWANAESTKSLTVKELGFLFNLDTGEKHDQQVEWPMRLRDYLSNLTDDQGRKLVELLESGVLD